MTSLDTAENDARVERVFAAIRNIDEPSLLAMKAVWIVGNADIRETAWAKVKAQMRRDPRSRIMDQVHERLATWVNTTANSWSFGALGRAAIAPSSTNAVALRRDAVPPVLDAIVAMLFDDVLNNDERDELLEPLRRATETRTETQDG